MLRVGRTTRTTRTTRTGEEMIEEKEKSFSHYVLATSEFRQLGKVEQAVKYLKLTSLSPNKVHNDTKVSRSAICRGIKAAEAGRTVGKNGRPDRGSGKTRNTGKPVTPTLLFFFFFFFMN